MDEAIWHVSTDVAAMLEWAANRDRFRSVTKTTGPQGMWPPMSERKLRLFACAAFRLRYGRFKKEHRPEGYRIAELGELLADGVPLPPDYPRPVLQGFENAHEGSDFCPLMADAGMAARRMAQPLDVREGAAQANLLRDIVGNPFCPVTVGEACGRCGGCGTIDQYEGAYPDAQCPRCDGTGRVRPPWFATEGVNTARAVYEDRAWGHLPILADLLEEEGCPDEVACERCQLPGRVVFYRKCPGCSGAGRVPNPILQHLRGPGPHARGCWAVDLLTGRG